MRAALLQGLDRLSKLVIKGTKSRMSSGELLAPCPSTPCAHNPIIIVVNSCLFRIII